MPDARATQFDPETFADECRAAFAEDDGRTRLLRLMRDRFANPDDVRAGLGDPREGGIFPILVSDELTIVNIVWKPGMTIVPHNHETWAIIGIYAGQEDNVWWKRIDDDPDGHIEPAGERTLMPGDVMPMGEDAIHSVTNPLTTPTGAIHIYGGNFFDMPRSEWDADGIKERPYDQSRVASFKD